ncbi:hypothetical protein CU098_005243 [Rhizopus stolonifer]|uniref:Uncharacterized protein n=1 Tax=Rhizopus stolonifer TaxID=4846 RepID=A0A367JVG2_RHIST|nr:hypothetical protein CU098_005243 [Rhizopus stolonifer]
MTAQGSKNISNLLDTKRVHLEAIKNIHSTVVILVYYSIASKHNFANVSQKQRFLVLSENLKTFLNATAASNQAYHWMKIKECFIDHCDDTIPREHSQKHEKFSLGRLSLHWFTVSKYATIVPLSSNGTQSTLEQMKTHDEIEGM